MSAYTYVCAIKAPGFGVITEDRGLTLDKVQFEMLGTAKKVSVSLDDTIILHGGGDKKLIEERCAEVEERIIDPLKVVRTALVDAARICSSSPLNLSKGPLCKLSAMTKFLFPAL
ncbi:chaperonin CPN60-like 2, mitochondrial isoform X3 [Quercus robur]|uniref:chaperonin CPN60-like 2, mitochondrial isoform X3 n=1 Tax=Quercus robur TaxID=38942 RepID=UPI00216145E0|nr:chaperonin CPN60-like 2, mitochondrial isoform X3 [Quercus robur]